MNKFDAKKIMPRYRAISLVMIILAVCVVGKSLYIMTAKRDYWMKVAERQKRDSVTVKPNRGNILSCTGQLLASSLPEFKIYMDFVALKEAKSDSLWDVKVDSICNGLHKIFPDKSAAEFKQHLSEGKAKMKRHWAIYNERINYNTFCEVKDLPMFKLNSNKSGFHWEEFNARQRSYGSLAGRTIGAMYGAKDTARFGLELSYDSILRGTNGIVHRRKVRNKFLDITDTPPIDGADIVTTLDVSMQDLAERSVINELKEINGNVGVAIVMEVKTGDIKAIVNMEKCFDGQYREIHNHAVSDLLEPGSVFKPASLLVALDDGVVDTTLHVETGSGVWQMYGRDMKDHNWRKGGYGLLTFAQTLWYSSNIGVSRIIDDHYKNNPEKFVQGIHRLGLADDLKIPLVGATPARIRMPHKNSHGQYDNWSKTALPWMSIGYETQVPPISTLTFYNALANNGTMMRPRFVTKVVKNGETIMEFPPEVMHEHIAKDASIKKMQTILEQVVSIGLGKKAGSPNFKVAGKTGTAQMSKGAGGYKSGVVNYLLSFAGYFPADNPRYSCIVCIQKSGLPASGGGMSGKVFHEISEGIMAQSLKLDVKDARDSASIFVPQVKDGNILAADYVLTHLGINAKTTWSGNSFAGKPIWGKAETIGNKYIKLEKQKQYGKGTVPDVIGLGARDAVYQMESRGIRTQIYGRGKVVKQTLIPGTLIKKGATCSITLE
ncbi:MAG: penicillin-binding protein [Prevotella sp.]|uniref:penicillin-binding protein n=1 Tax=Prevotella sp. TaxID=59823 RepID=UPI00033E113A|nr:penicillin-binding protein [Prevotella sp. CAG:732]MED9897908.1 penicillin-binding protein [Prevotella sp.]CDD20678.1 putative penicillin-binding protein 2 [Prevotella sp. CAG:732]